MDNSSNGLPGTERTVFARPLRGVRAIRLSVLTDETTSPERQRDSCDAAAAQLNIDFGEGENLREAVDLAVSASKTAPWQRPELGEWLTRPDEWDVLVWWRFDRAVRSQSDMHELATWAAAHGKIIVFAEGVSGGMQTFDFRDALNPVTRMMLNQFAFAAEMEAWSIKERVTGAHAALRNMNYRHATSTPAYGYKIVPMPAELGGVGKTLVQDESAVKVLLRIIKDLLDGVTVKKICTALTAEGVLSPRDHWSRLKGKGTGGKVGAGRKGSKTVEQFRWTRHAVRRILTTPALLGWKMHRGNPVRNAQGEPVMATAEPILTREEFDVIGALFDEKRATGGEQPEAPSDASKLLHVALCNTCGAPMYKQGRARSVNQADTYRCSSSANHTPCAAPTTIRADWLEEWVEARFLDLAGRIPVLKTLITPGYDPQRELDAVTAEYEAHQELKGEQRSRAALASWKQRLAALDNRMVELEATPVRPEKRERFDTGQTIADVWTDADDETRRGLLVEAGFRVRVGKARPGGWRRLDETRLHLSVIGELDPAIESWMGLRDELGTGPDGAPVAGSKMRIGSAVGLAA
ncbi:recombinase family protein [Kitasatospora griseola]|uniref:recombinase family protein n=1 Tax=Kitasatospora griseola TaxID=2064 RepID=UPI00365BAD02